MAYQKSVGVSDPFYMKKFIDNSETGFVSTTAGTGQANGIAITGTAASITAHATNALAVYSSNSSTADTINGTAGTTAYSLAATKSAMFF